MKPSLPNYAELHCVSNFSFLRGASHPAELIEQAQALGYAALAITDECSLAGIVRAHVAAKEHGFKLIAGSEIGFEDGPRIVLLAANREGYGNLCELITLGRRRAKKGAYRLVCADLEDGLPGCLALLVPGKRIDTEHARWLAGRFAGRAWIAVELHYGPRDKARLAELRALGDACGLPLAAAGDVHMHARSRRALQDMLTAIGIGVAVADAGYALFPNAERHLRRRVRLAQVYPEALLEETAHIAARCTFSLDELRYEYPQELVPENETPAGWLRKRVDEGAARRYPAGVPAKVRTQIEHELALINELAYEYYFLTVDDIVRFARGASILCQGRGSAANSAVCYCLHITAIDPDRSRLLFERFISRERNEPPDIDVDFEHERREEVIQYIYAKYGRERAALAAAVIRYRSKSALRDVGRALGFSAEQIDCLAKLLAWWDEPDALPARLRESGFDPQSLAVRQLIGMVGELRGFPRHLSQHVGGFVIGRGRISRLVPIENAAMLERSIIQWDKDDLDAIGLLKVDVLALGMLSAIRRTLQLVGAVRGAPGIPFTLQDIPSEDPAVYAMIRRADTVGVFQIESRAQMSMLPRLRPESFYDLVIEIAIVRPGPIQGDMVHPYLRRKHGLERIDYPSEAVKGVLERTLGVPLFQEQVMELAVAAAGFTPGEADQLRRAMAAWKRKGGLGPFQKKLIEGLLANGYGQAYAERIFKQILGFGGYGFPESHSASFALLAYASAWLKLHHPAEFLCALLNSQPMGFYSPSQLVQDARRAIADRRAVKVHPADVVRSDRDCTLEGARDAPEVRLGLRLVGGLSGEGAERLVAARRTAAFTSVDDLAHRAGLDHRDLDMLARAGALAPLAGNRHLAQWQVAGIEMKTPLMREACIQEESPALRAPTEGEDLVADYASLGLTLSRHPLALLRPHLARMRSITAEALLRLPHGRAARVSGIVTGRQRPGTASGTVFVTLEDETGWVNVIVWPALVEKQRRELLASRLMTVHGTLEREGEVAHLIARRLVDDSRLLGRLASARRDFR
ncbi:MAG: error-prone DNA polymerase [Betaproteobacteria bacterium]|nr:error-prone DNA polymerase [Betaproteobacteria bacterium]